MIELVGQHGYADHESAHFEGEDLGEQHEQDGSEAALYDADESEDEDEQEPSQGRSGLSWGRMIPTQPVTVPM